MSKSNNDTIDKVTLKLSGIIGVFDLIEGLASAAAMGSEYKDHDIMGAFAFFISEELQGVHDMVSSLDYNND